MSETREKFIRPWEASKVISTTGSVAIIEVHHINEKLCETLCQMKLEIQAFGESFRYLNGETFLITDDTQTRLFHFKSQTTICIAYRHDIIKIKWNATCEGRNLLETDHHLNRRKNIRDSIIYSKSETKPNRDGTLKLEFAFLSDFRSPNIDERDEKLLTFLRLFEDHQTLVIGFKNLSTCFVYIWHRHISRWQ